jgi:WD40 repeat protein/serine/threonine protein kinase
MNNRQDREEDIFEEALTLAPEQRAAYLLQACQGDESLRKRVEKLLEAAQAADPFFNKEPLRMVLGGGADETAQAVHSAAPGSEEPEEAQEPGDRIGRYKLLQKIGEGGCGVVYMAEQTEPVRRRVALKVIKLGMDTKQVIARFEAERQALALMDHPNIAKVLDAGTTDAGRPYFVMELVRGTKITEYCDENNLPTAQRLDLFIQICQAIQHAHQKGIIHRDIKPSNILVTINDAVPVPKVIDFGIAKATTGQQLTDKTLFTAYEQFIGTPAYMSPEQTVMTSLDIDTRSDIYSLGVLLYELLTGKTPFDAKELLEAGFDEMRRTIREKEPSRPSTRLSTMVEGELTTTAKHRQSDAPKLVSLVRGDLDWIVMKALEKDRARRYETANGFAADLKRFLNNEPVAARPPNSVYRLQKLVRRNKLAFAAIGAVTIALLLGTAISTWQAIAARKSRHTAESARLAEQEQRLTAQTERDKAQAAQAAEIVQRKKVEQSEKDAQRLLYAANMNLVQQAWDRNNVGRVQQLLDETANYPDRGFEWFFWQRQLRLKSKMLQGHVAPIWALAFSPDGRRMVSGSSDRSAKIWECATGKVLFTLRGHAAGIRSVAFSPDGRQIVTASSDQTARTWDARTGEHLRTFKGHRAEVRCAAFSPDGQRIVTGSADWTAIVWDASSGHPLLTFREHRAAVISTVFSIDGSRITSSGFDGTKLWEGASGAELPPSGETSGRHAAPVSAEPTAWLWGKTDPDDTPDTDALGRESGVECMTVSPDRRWVVTGSLDNAARIWDLTSGRLMHTLDGHAFRIRSVAISPNGDRIATGSGDQTVKIWDAARGLELLTLRGHTNDVVSVAFSPDGQRVAAGSSDGAIEEWELASAQESRTLRGHLNAVAPAAFSPDGKRIVAGCLDGTVNIFDVDSGRELVTLGGRGSALWCAAFSRDGQWVASGYQNASTCIWDAATGRLLRILVPDTNGVHSVAFSPDRKWIATTGHSRDATIWDTATGKEVCAFQGHFGMVSSVAFSQDGQRLLTGGFDGTARIREISTRKELLLIQSEGEGWQTLTPSPDERQILSAWNRTAALRDAATGNPNQLFEGHNQGIVSVGFSPDAQRIITGSDDHTARIWDRANGKCLLTLGNDLRERRGAAFSPDGRRILTCGNQAVEIWEAAAPEGAATRQEQAKEAAAAIDVLRRQESAAVEREVAFHAQDPAPLTSWLVLAPIAMERQTEGAAVRALDQEQISGEGQVRPHAGDKTRVGQFDMVWEPVHLKDYLLDFNALLLPGGGEIKWSVGYAVCYLSSPAELHDLVMRVGSDDQSKIYLNGQEIYRYAPGGRGMAGLLDSDVVAGVELKKGLNAIVFKVVQKEGGWAGSIRFTQADGRPVHGIKATLDPEGKDSQ